MDSLIYARRKAQGLCVSCGNEKAKEDTYTVCSECREKRNKKRYDKYSNGICVNCGEKSNGWLCNKCKEIENTKKREKRQSNKQKGLCSRCGHPVDREGYSTCNKCLEYGKEARKIYTQVGICYKCHKNKIYSDEKLCPECRAEKALNSSIYHSENKEKHNESQREYHKRRHAELISKGICTRCGKRNAAIGKKKCKLCQEKENENRRLKNEKKLIDRPNRCHFCNNDALPNMKVCDVHYKNILKTVNLPQTIEARKKVKMLWH